MIATNPVASNATILAATRVARLYVLTRDAYLAAPADTRLKLESLADLRRVTSESLVAPARGDFTEVTGVRLIELLRVAMHNLAGGTDQASRRLALADVLLTSRPPTGAGWAAAPGLLLSDAASHLLPEVNPQEIARVARHRRTAYAGLHRATGIHAFARPILDEADSATAAVAEVLGEVLGLTHATALASAIVTVHGGHLEASGVGLVLEPLPRGSAATGFVGTELARTSTQAFIDQLACLETTSMFLTRLREPLAAAVCDLRDDIVAVPPTGEDERTRLRAAARSSEHLARRLAPRTRSLFGLRAQRQRADRLIPPWPEATRAH